MSTLTLSPRELLDDAQQLLQAGEVVAAALLVQEAARLVGEVPEAERGSCRRMVEQLVVLFTLERDRLASAQEGLLTERRAHAGYRKTEGGT